MRPGERQVAPSREGIRADHVARYQWADTIIPASSDVIDIACGVGYGADLLAQKGRKVFGVDIDREAIAYARAHYPAATYDCRDMTDPRAFDLTRTADWATAFECLEHVENPVEVLRNIPAWQLLASVPNEDHFPYTGQLYHHRHYTEAEFRTLLDQSGWEVEEVKHQEGPESGVGDVAGRTLVARARRRVGRHVAILGLGPSLEAFVDHTKRLGGATAYCDEVWGINAVGDVVQCDRIFHMDDVRVQEARAKLKPAGNIASMLRWMKKHPGPIYTSHVEPGYPGLVPFPLQDVVRGTGHAYFNGTVAYALAFAIWSGVRRVSIFGCDYSYQNSHHAERGRACLEYWIAIAKERGIAIAVPDKTSLLDAIEGPDAMFYGYDGYKVRLGAKMAIQMEAKPLPTAEEMERRYDHSRPTNPLVEKGLT